jgi:hypothetical protein
MVIGNAPSLLRLKIFRLKVAVVTPGLRREAEHAVIRFGDALLVIHGSPSRQIISLLAISSNTSVHPLSIVLPKGVVKVDRTENVQDGRAAVVIKP